MRKALTPEELYARCDMGGAEFASTREIKCHDGTIGQERAVSAIEFGLGMDSRGFNIYVLGEPGTGKMTTIRERLGAITKGRAVPPDWCYVYNFRDPDVPQAIELPPGKAQEFHNDMDELVTALRSEIPKLFESKEYEKMRSRTVEEFQRQQKEMFGEVENDAKAKGFSIRKTVSGLAIVPVTQSGEPLTEEEFEKLDDDHKQKIESTGKVLQEKLDDAVRNIKTREKQIRTDLEKLERDAVLSSIGHFIEDLKDKHKDIAKVTAYLDDVREDILKHLQDFKGGEEEQPSPLPFMRPPKAEPTFTRYAVNVLVNNGSTEGAPCVFESNPTYYNLFGRIEHKFQYGVAVTDFSMIKAGSLHRANGGYIVLDALDLLRNLFSYDAMKRSIRNREIKIEDIWEQYRLITSTTLKPEGIPLNVKVVLIGTPHIYYLLFGLDEEYRELFKVKADFEGRMARNEFSVRKYTEFIASKCEEEGLLHFDRSGASRVVEHGSRLADHQCKLSSRFSEIADLLRESHYWAKRDGAESVSADHVERAIRERVYRSNRIEERLRELMADGTLIVETEGSRVGQVNGLAVLSLGDYTFGKPSRITARAYAGRAGVVNLERETKMSGRIHEKAVMILTSWLGATYAADKPVSLSATITFEQLYDMIEGDSATCAELYALLSAISGVPLSQELAVTGSMDQNGEVQPIGGVNEKIEGFFEIAKLRGFAGKPGVIIPSKNVRNLMLNREVVDAVRAGRFSIHSMDRMEEGLELLTGMPFGERQSDGAFPEGTINHLVMKRLSALSEASKAKDGNGNGDKKDKEPPACEGGCGKKD